MKKAKFNKLMELMHKTLDVDNWHETSKEWELELVKNGWTADEFDTELMNRVYKKKDINEED